MLHLVSTRKMRAWLRAGDHSSFAGDDGVGRIPTNHSRPAVVASLLIATGFASRRRRQRVPLGGKDQRPSIFTPGRSILTFVRLAS
jgi:hypothetical protein